MNKVLTINTIEEYIKVIDNIPIEKVEKYLKVNKLKNGYLYELKARNSSCGVWIEAKKSFILSKWEWERNYLIFEKHWDICEFHGTVKPISIIEKFPFELKDYPKDDSKNKEILKYLHSKERPLYRRLKLGIFWIYEKKVYAEFQSFVWTRTINGFKDSDLSHYKVWNKVKNQHPKFYLYEYEDIPRGRVVYNIEENIFIIYCNENILQNETSKRLILEKFELLKENSIFKEDEHYRII